MICGAWADDCCEHIDEETGKYKAEFQAKADEANKAEVDAWSAEMEEWAKKHGMKFPD